LKHRGLVQNVTRYGRPCLNYFTKMDDVRLVCIEELFRHMPCAIFPVDHDVYHRNVWGRKVEKSRVQVKDMEWLSQDSGGV